jgi:hypothetical protein
MVIVASPAVVSAKLMPNLAETGRTLETAPDKSFMVILPCPVAAIKVFMAAAAVSPVPL